MLLHTLLFLFFLHHSVHSWSSEGFFNRSSFAAIDSAFDITGQTSFSFRTCSHGQLIFQQQGSDMDYVNITLLPSGVLEFSWMQNLHKHSVTAGSNLIDNRWHDVDLVHLLGSVELTVSGSSVLVANATYNSDLLSLKFDHYRPQLMVGRDFTGCILQGAGMVLNDSSVYYQGVEWGKCPLPSKGGCDGYEKDPCFYQPCHEHSKCVSLSNGGYKCDCTNRYAGLDCGIDLGPLCLMPTYNKCLNGGTCQEDPTGNSTWCACGPRFTGSVCETAVENSFCDHNPCRHGGTCNINQSLNGYVCTCPQGLAGKDCELNVDECESSPCQNNGTCTDEINSYTCECKGTGYRGRNCEENINECEENNPCYVGSQCFDRYGSYMCACPHGFGGKHCDQEVNECDSSPCQNGGSCVDGPNSYLCHCQAGFAGVNCEVNIDDCVDINCPNNSYCVDGINEFTCVCNPGYAGGVPNCKEINECSEHPCLNGATCQDRLNGFTCECPNGFFGSHCQIDIDECGSNPCMNGAMCIDGPGTFKCECVVGYSGSNCEVDINDCVPNPCKNNNTCTDLVNDYICECSPGWEGKTCAANIDECRSQPCMHGKCVDGLNDFTCVCEPGYEGPLCNVDINECDSNPCWNGATCTDLKGNFSCKCHEDFMGRHCERAYDACDPNRCMHGSTCLTTKPSRDYQCVCQQGYKGDNCEIDIDDCQGIICPTAGQQCFDLVNSYECRCPIGFTGSDCAFNINECASNPCANGTCIDGQGNFTCDCPSGLTGRLCESDINECEPNPCRNGICDNLFGSYRCFCTPGYTGIHCEVEVNECWCNPCMNGATCEDQVNAYKCRCLPGYTGSSCETDIDECATNPCQNGATCSDLINRYECSCIPGFMGQDCEINIDECASQPCLNGGKCLDLINEFSCNCTDSGFTGQFCENNIDDCAANPCQNGARCEDLVKDYRCHCFDGYTGKNCEHDTDDCGSNPCQNNGLCLENSNQTLYRLNYPGFPPSFAYEAASGYRCICARGYTGVNCETDIDDCENHQCQHGYCVDSIDDYYCACKMGFDGTHCDREINECDVYSPCQNNATCMDRIADYECLCLPDYGGKNCQLKLIGCNNIHCLNGATCRPLLAEGEQHDYECMCVDGFVGRFCEISTTVSFKPTDSLSVLKYNDKVDMFDLEFRFRTTLPSGVISSGYTPSGQYLLYLWNGMVKVDIYDDTGRIAELFSKHGQNDSLWKTVSLGFSSNQVSLNVSGWALQKQLHFPTLNFTVHFGASDIASHRANEIEVPDFIGCMQDIHLNGDNIIPNQNSILRGATEGCPRREQCENSPCNSGVCKDNWLSYECVCSRPFFGATCQYSYTAATFGYQNQVSQAKFPLPPQKKKPQPSILEVSFFLRTRNESGLVFYLGSALNSATSNCSGSFIIVRMMSNGMLQMMLKDREAMEVVQVNRRVNDGQNYFIEAKVNNSAIILTVNDTSEAKTVPSLSPVCQEVLYIGSIPHTRQKRQAAHFTDSIDTLLAENISFFKGIIQDFRVNGAEVVFYVLNETDSNQGFPRVLGKAELLSVQRGVVSDDPCNTLQPCLHGSQCEDLWNEYKCICPDDYRGKNCEEKKPCAENTCPGNAECRNLDIGYECVTSASFNGNQTGVHYHITNLTLDAANITFAFRTASGGTLMWLESEPPNGHFLHVEVTRTGTLEVRWDLGPPSAHPLLKMVSQKLDSTGRWEQVQIWFEENLVHLKVSNNTENLSEDNYLMSLGDLLSSGASVYIGYQPGPTDSHHFKGCIEDVRIGNLLLPFIEVPGSLGPFHAVTRDIEIGCTLCYDNDCVHGQCSNSTESYECNCFDGYEGKKCDTDMCITKNPCNNNGTCHHMFGTGPLMCSCLQGFMGPRCSDINHCDPEPCQNQGSCVQAPETVNGFQCSCPPHFKGERCEENDVLTCENVDCFHGSCITIDLNETMKFQCLCKNGYIGTYCEETVRFCDNLPCQNGGECSIYEDSDFATFNCECRSGFTGTYCEMDIDECHEMPDLCNKGTCINLPGTYMCKCDPGFMGEKCARRISSCRDRPDVCYNGTCSDVSGGGYNCDCKMGFIGSHCSIYDECEPSKCNNQGQCQASFDEREIFFDHMCTCNDGFSGKDCTKELSRGGGDDTNLIVIILIPVLSLFLLCLLIGAVVFLRIAKKKRATRGTYSPSRQEMFGSRVEMNHVMKPPPEERLI